MNFVGGGEMLWLRLLLLRTSTLRMLNLAFYACKVVISSLQRTSTRRVLNLVFYATLLAS